MPALETKDLFKSFDGFVAIRDVSFRLEAGEKHAIIGPNGAGKTTFFNLITGHLQPDRGEVALEGRPITGMPPHGIVRLGVARSFQRINIYPRMSVFENVQVALIARDRRHFSLFALGAKLNRDETEELLSLVGLADEADETAGELAYGKQKQLELAIALAANPRVLLLDEPTAGMSRHDTNRTIELLQRIKGRGMTKIVIEHDMHVVFSLADRISVLAQGAIIAEGSPDEVRGNPVVQEAYLGGAHL